MHEFNPLLELGDSTIIVRAIENLKTAGASPVIIVGGYKADQLMDYLWPLDIMFVRNENYASSRISAPIRAQKGLRDPWSTWECRSRNRRRRIREYTWRRIRLPKMIHFRISIGMTA